MEWTPAAILAAKRELRADLPVSAWNTDDEIVAALDAAIKAQGLVDEASSKRFASAQWALSRADALEEAAAKVKEMAVSMCSQDEESAIVLECAATAIRNLK